MAESVETLHPAYEEHTSIWELTRDCVAGESAIRGKIVTYLPPPPGMATTSEFLATGKRTVNDRYHFYASFADFPEIVSPTLNGIQGLIHEKPPEFILPASMEYLREAATPDGESLEELWERITQEILVTGRIVLLGEVVNDRLLLCPYPTESLINWRLDPIILGGRSSLVVLREVNLVQDGSDEFKHAELVTYRVLRMIEGAYTVQIYVKDSEGKLTIVASEEGEPFITPILFGRVFDRIPIMVLNALNTGFEYGSIPMLPMAKRARTIFRKSADYNRSLYIKGDPQCIIFGIDKDDAPTEIGGGAVWVFDNAEANAKYLDIDGQGIPLMRQSINDEFDRFADEIGMLFEGVTSGYESGEALRRRQAMRQVTVKSLVINAAEGLEAALRMLGRFMNVEPGDIRVNPNLDFTEAPILGQELREFITAKKMGVPISNKTLHELLRRRQITSLTFEEEMELLNNEALLADMRFSEQQNTATIAQLRALADQMEASADKLRAETGESDNPDEGGGPE